MRKKITAVFKSSGLRITVETYLKAVNFFDINMDLRTGVNKPLSFSIFRWSTVHTLVYHVVWLLHAREDADVYSAGDKQI